MIAHSIPFEDLSRGMRFPTMWYVLPAKPQISLRIRAYAQSDQRLCLSLEYYMSVKLLTEHHLELLSLIQGYTGLSESTMSKCHIVGNHMSRLKFISGVHRSPGHTTSDIIHIGTANPVCLYSMNPRTMTANFLDMYDVFPVTSGSYKPRVKLAPLAAPLDDTVILHEEVVSCITFDKP